MYKFLWNNNKHIFFLIKNSRRHSGGEQPDEPEESNDDDKDLTSVNPKTTTDKLIEKTRRVGHIQNKARGIGAERTTNKCLDLDLKRKQGEANKGADNSTEDPTRKKLNNSDLFPPEVRPDWLKEDKTINSLDSGIVANVIVQNQITVTINKQNTLKEE